MRKIGNIWKYADKQSRHLIEVKELIYQEPLGEL